MDAAKRVNCIRISVYNYSFLSTAWKTEMSSGMYIGNAILVDHVTRAVALHIQAMRYNTEDTQTHEVVAGTGSAVID